MDHDSRHHRDARILHPLGLPVVRVGGHRRGFALVSDRLRSENGFALDQEEMPHAVYLSAAG